MRYCATVLSILGLFCAGQAQAAIITADQIIDSWTSESESIGHRQNAQWAVTSLNRVTNGYNWGGTKVSDFTVSGDFEFSSVLHPQTDNDVMGLVFGWQDVDNTYLLSWGGGGVGVGGLEGFGEWNGPMLTRFVDGVAVELAGSDTPLWSHPGDYEFSIERDGDSILVTIADESGTYFDTSVIDSSFMTGAVGLMTFSQHADFSNTSFATPGGTDQVVPEPASIATWSFLALIGLFVWRRRRR